MGNMTMNDINTEATDGMFGTKRVLGTFKVVELPNGRFGVSDDYQNDKLVGFGFATVQAAVKAYKSKDDARLI
jgi:hypothetical protein